MKTIIGIAIMAMIHITVAQDNPAMKQAEAVKDKYVKELMSLPGVQGVGVGIGPSIVVYVIKDNPTKPTLPTNLEGIPVRIIEGEKIRPQ